MSLEPGLFDKSFNLIMSWEELKERGFTNAVIQKDSSFISTDISGGNILYEAYKNKFFKRMPRDLILVFPEDLKRIGDYNFKDSIISEVYIPESVKSIGANAFAYSELTALTIFGNPNICSSAFKECLQLRKATLPDVKKIPSYCFESCQRLAEIDIKNCEEIGDSAFTYTSLKSVDMSKVKTISARAFRFSTLHDVKFGKLKEIGDRAFENADLGEVILPPSVTHIGELCFDGSKLREIKLSPNIKRIPKSCFARTKLTGIEIPEGIESIDDCAFCSASNLRNISMPLSLKEIGDSAFTDTNLKEITVPPFAIICEHGIDYSVKMNMTQYTYNKSNINRAGVNIVTEIDLLLDYFNCAFTKVNEILNNLDTKEEIEL